MREQPPLPGIELLYAQAACGLLLTESNGTIRQVNDTFCGWIGHTAEDLVGRLTMQQLLTVGARMFHQTHWQPLLELQSAISEVKMEFLHRDGHRIPMVLNARLHPLSDGGRMVSVLDGLAGISVHNFGQPIAAEAMPHLFLAMNRGSQLQDASGGVGLGLYIVNEIARGHGGSVGVSSYAGEGTRVWIEFPAVQAC